MKQVVQRLRDGRIEVMDVPPPSVAPSSVLVENAYSLISAGTERAKVELGESSLVAKARRRPQDVARVVSRARREGLLTTYRMVRDRLEAPSPLGYSCAGTVSFVGELAEGFAVGDCVACGGAGFANHASVVAVPHTLCARVPDGVPLEWACFATVGAIALQGVRQAEARVGDRVAVVGLGLVGLLTVQILRASGCHVLGMDVSPPRADLATRLGASVSLALGRDDVDSATRGFTDDIGFDEVIITASTESSEPVRLAGRVSRDRGTVVVVGDVGMDVPRASYYEKELQLRLSRSYGPGRYDAMYEETGIDYPVGYVRWTEQRNMQEFLSLLGSGAVDVAQLVSRTYDVDSAPDAYASLFTEGDGRPIGVLLEYPHATEVWAARPGVASHDVLPTESPGVAFIGAGNFARSVLLPALKRAGGIRLTSVSTLSGLSASEVAEREGFARVATDATEVLAEGDTTAVVIATHHQAHAELATAALEAGKHVFVEKPLAVTAEQLGQVISAYDRASTGLMVGFNRRYAPMSVAALAERRRHGVPAVVNIRVNAGPLAEDHWTRRLEVGGGRLVGEVCHFVDLACFLVDARPIEVSAMRLGNERSPVLSDSTCATLRFADGSVASITYVAEGDSAFPKELVELFVGGTVVAIDDFKRCTTVIGGRSKATKARTTDKGHAGEMAAFVRMVRDGAEVATDFPSAVMSTLATLAIIRSLSEGRPIAVREDLLLGGVLGG